MLSNFPFFWTLFTSLAYSKHFSSRIPLSFLSRPFSSSFQHFGFPLSPNVSLHMFLHGRCFDQQTEIAVCLDSPKATRSDLHNENWDEGFPRRNYDYYGNHSSNSSVFQQWPISLSCQLEAPMLKHLKIQVILAMNQSCNYLDECFLDPRINKPFTLNQEFVSFEANQLPGTSLQQ